MKRHFGIYKQVSKSTFRLLGVILILLCALRTRGK